MYFSAPSLLAGSHFPSHLSFRLAAMITGCPLIQSCAPSLHFTHVPILHGACLSFCVQTSAPHLLPCALGILLFFPIKSCPTYMRHFFHGSHFHSSVGAEVLRVSNKMAKTEIGRVVMLEGATASTSFICNELWRQCSQN